MKIRRARPEDGPSFLADAFGDSPRYELWVADDAGAVIAYAACFSTYSTFLAKPTLYLEDLFVHPDQRRRGVATEMMATLRRVAAERGCGRFEWSVLDWNEGAQALYEKLGAQELAQWRLMRVEL